MAHFSLNKPVCLLYNKKKNHIDVSFFLFQSWFQNNTKRTLKTSTGLTVLTGLAKTSFLSTLDEKTKKKTKLKAHSACQCWVMLIVVSSVSFTRTTTTLRQHGKGATLAAGTISPAKVNTACYRIHVPHRIEVWLFIPALSERSHISLMSLSPSATNISAFPLWKQWQRVTWRDGWMTEDGLSAVLSAAKGGKCIWGANSWKRASERWKGGFFRVTFTLHHKISLNRSVPFSDVQQMHLWSPANASKLKPELWERGGSQLSQVFSEVKYTYLWNLSELY